MPQWALNAVVLPTGRVAYWGRAALGTAHNGGRDNAGMFYVWDPVTGQSVERPPPDVFFDRDADGIEDDWGPAPLFCSGQSLLPSGELYVAGGNRFAPWVRASGGGNPEYAGWWGTYSFDPWTERWTIQPRMTHGRWYPTQVELPDGRIAITSGYDENGNGDDNDTMEVFTPHPQRGGVGTLVTVPAGFHDTAGFYPHMQVVPGDYWGMDDLPHTGREDPQDHAEIYEPAYLFDGDARAPRPRVTGGPSAVRWGDDFGIRVAEVAGRPIVRVTLVGPPAVTHAVDMNRKFAELPVVERVPGVGVNVVAPAGADLAPPGWYMLFAFDAAGTPAVAHWVQIRGDAADAPRVVPGDGGDPGDADGGDDGSPGPGGSGGGVGVGGPAPTAGAGAAGPSAPAGLAVGAPAPGRAVRDDRGPRIGVIVRRPKRSSTALSIRIGADEPARLRLRLAVQGRTIRRSLRLTTRRLSRSIRVRLARSERARLRRGRSLRLRIGTTARDPAGNITRRSLRMVVRVGRAGRSG